MNSKGLVLIISGPSGVGKGTAVKKLLSENKDEYALSVSATTRAPREGEENGREYFFMTKEEFEKLIAENKVLEYAQYCENYYGTPKRYVEQTVSQGKNVILEIEVQGALQVMKKAPDAVSVFIMPPSWEVLKQRLIGRGTETAEVIEERLNTAAEEIKLACNYDYIVINDDLDDCVNHIKDIVCAEKSRYAQMEDFVKEVLLNV